MSLRAAAAGGGGSDGDSEGEGDEALPVGAADSESITVGYSGGSGNDEATSDGWQMLRRPDREVKGGMW